MNKSIEKRLLYSFTAITVLVLLLVSLGLSYLINEFFWESRRREIIIQGRQLARAVSELRWDNPRAAEEYLRSVDQYLHARVWLVDSEKQVIASSGRVPRHGGGGHRRFYTLQLQRIRDMVDEVLKGEIKTIRAFHPFFEEDVIVVGMPVANRERQVTGVLLLNAPVASAEKFLHDIYFYICGVGALAVLLSWRLTKLLSRRLVRPLIFMRENAAAMARGDYSRHMQIKGEDEVADLGHSLNSLSQDLANFVDKTQRMEQLRRDFVANVSHELRTPITIIRGYTEAVLDGTVTDAGQARKYQSLILDETIRLEGLIRELLDISRLQARVEELSERVPLDAIVRDCADKLLVKAKERPVEIIVEAQTGAYVYGIGNRLVQLVMILADNAIKYAQPGGWVRLAAYSADGRTYLVVEDNGIGIAEEEQAKIWERFYKIDKSHAKAAGGSGLGLAIAREIIDIHKAELNLYSRLGEGTKIQVIFDGANNN